MIVIYFCYGGAHSSPIASAIHLGILDSAKTPTKEQVWNVQYFDKVDSSDRGRVFPVGTDQSGNEIYVCGRGSEKRGIEQAVRSGMSLAGRGSADVLFVDTLPAVNNLMRVGGFLSRQLKWTAIGRPLVISGVQRAFPSLVEIVLKTKAKIGDNEPVMKNKRESP